MEESPKPVRLHFEKYVPDNCDPDLNPLIFVHGIGDSSESWNNILEEVAEETKRKAYAIDLRNHGKSEWSECFSNESLCVDIENFMIQNGIKKTVFVSHSLGARACMSICLKKPELVEKIVVEDARLQDMPPAEMKSFLAILNLAEGINFLSKIMNEKEMRNFIAKRVQALYPNNRDLEMFVHYIPGHKEADGTFKLAFNLQAVVKGIQDKSTLLLDYDHFQEFNGPAIVIYGTNSALKTDTDELLPKYFPNAKFYKFENSSHYVHKEYRKEFTAKVCEFLNS